MDSIQVGARPHSLFLIPEARPNGDPMLSFDMATADRYVDVQVVPALVSDLFDADLYLCGLTGPESDPGKSDLDLLWRTVELNRTLGFFGAGFEATLDLRDLNSISLILPAGRAGLAGILGDQAGTGLEEAFRTGRLAPVELTAVLVLLEVAMDSVRIEAPEG